MKEKIAHVLQALSESFQNESDEKHIDTVKKLMEENEYLDIAQPEMFGLLTSTTLDEQKDLLARIVLGSVEIEEDKFEEICFVYTQYPFIEQHLDVLITKFEGLACSADKTRWLIDSYVAYLQTGNLPVIKKEEYWHPGLLDMQLWMDWIQSIQTLYYGNEEKYIELKQQLKTQYSKNIKEKLDSIHQLFASNEYLKEITTREKRGENETVYCFYDALTKDKGMIYVNSKAKIAYTYFLESEQRFAKYKDPLPKWFKELTTLERIL